MNKKNPGPRPKLILLKKHIHALERPLQAAVVAGNKATGGSDNSNTTVCAHWPPRAADNTVCQEWPV
ncbi:hypothetical protein [Taibaiella helva]|uniref:hypothetical protein n=1 Tax=Taibaiella helva TaxID=2301235 RepID=UPI000E588DAC|nr:hypothetical protein [Taibaiella helva]